MFNWDEFRNGKVAVNCDNEEKAREFIKECHKRDMKWHSSSSENEIRWKEFKNDTCYCFSHFNDGHLGYSSTVFYEVRGYKIIKWESEKMKFKVGDKVRHIDNEDWKDGLKYRVVIQVLENGYLLSDGELTWYDNELKLYEGPTEFTFQEVIVRNIPGIYVNCNDDMARVQSVEIHEDGNFSINAEFKGLKEINLGLGINHNLKFKLQEPKKKVTIYKVEHKRDGKNYDFISKEIKLLQCYEFVVCDTSQGKSYGRIVDLEERELTDEEIKQYKECWRA